MTNTTTQIKVMLAQSYEGSDITNYLLSEKLDGVRALWDGENLYTRNGNIIKAPKSFTDNLPANISLDGELYIGKETFQKLIKTVKGKENNWDEVKYVVFDAPEALGGFYERYQHMLSTLVKNSSMTILEQIPARNNSHMFNLCETLCNSGAEGIIIKDPRSLYINGRTNKLLKFKPYNDDEAKVVAHNNKINGITVDYKGILFTLTIKKSEEVPDIGDIVTFSYSGFYDSGIPRFASYICIRDYEN